MDDRQEITVLLRRLTAGDRTAENELIPLVFRELHGLARRRFAFERPDHTLQPTALVSELYLRLIQDASVDWQNRQHLFATASRKIRQILIDHARERAAGRRPPPKSRVPLREDCICSERPTQAFALDQALEALAKLNPRQAQIIEMRFFMGLTNGEIASALDVTERTICRDWLSARAWLSRYLGPALRFTSAA